MFDTKQQILDQIRAGEDARAEFKELRFGEHGVLSPNTEEIAGEIVGFTNAEGGAIFLGVTDDGIVRGIPFDRADVVEQWIVNIASNNCEPPIRPLLRKEILRRPDGADTLVLLVEIQRGLSPHQTSGGRYYVRVGSTKRDLRPHELARLLQQRGRAFVFDEQAVLTATPDDLDRGRVDRSFGGASSIPRVDLLRNTRVTAADDQGVERPTIAALLAFGSDPQRHLPSAFIEAACYRGPRLTSDELVHAARIDGVVADQIDAAAQFVERFMLRPARKSAGREDSPQYEIDPVYEAIVNAVAHRDYSIAGSKIRLFLFADRLELYSPGALPNSLTVETMQYRVFTRNQLLVSFLARMKSSRTGRAFLESRGEGVRRILEAGESYAGRKPDYQLFDEELRLTIWARQSPHAES